MERNVLLTLRQANPNDFADSNGNKKQNVPYFEQNSLGFIEPQIRYFSETTDLDQFKKLYAGNQIFVMVNPHESRSIFNCIDWDLVEKELQYETEKLTQLLTKY